MQVDFSKIKFDEKGLIPAIVQDAATNAVLMLAYMNGESLAKTVETGYTWFWSRSRQELWNKGASSGHVQKVFTVFWLNCTASFRTNASMAAKNLIPVTCLCQDRIRF